jgi:membrane protein DedA with SNARE-associated domain
MTFWTTFSHAVGHFLAAYGLLAILVVMFLKEMGLPVPVPSDLILITAGIQAATGAYTLWELALVIEAALIVGGSVQFLLARSIGRPLVYRLGRLTGTGPARLDRAGTMLRKWGAPAVFVGLNIPGIRPAIVPASGLAGLRYRAFAPAMVAGTSLYYGWHVALGYVLGPAAVQFLAHLHFPIWPFIAALALLAVVIWLVRRARRKARKTAPDPGANAPHPAAETPESSTAAPSTAQP